jgi:hypothetical protein
MFRKNSTFAVVKIFQRGKHESKMNRTSKLVIVDKNGKKI